MSIAEIWTRFTFVMLRLSKYIQTDELIEKQYENSKGHVPGVNWRKGSRKSPKSEPKF